MRPERGHLCTCKWLCTKLMNVEFGKLSFFQTTTEILRGVLVFNATRVLYSNQIFHCIFAFRNALVFVFHTIFCNKASFPTMELMQIISCSANPLANMHLSLTWGNGAKGSPALMCHCWLYDSTMFNILQFIAVCRAKSAPPIGIWASGVCCSDIDYSWPGVSFMRPQTRPSSVKFGVIIELNRRLSCSGLLEIIFESRYYWLWFGSII